MQKIIQSSEFKEHLELFTSQTLTHKKLDETLNNYSHLYDNKMKEITNILDNLE